MLHSQQGSVYRVILACFIAVAFCFALSWPQYAKHRNFKHLNQAAELGRALAFAEGSYKQTQGAYTPQFSALEVSLNCPMISTAQGPQLDCAHYTYALQPDNTIKITNKHFPVWLTVDIALGTVACQYADEDWAGQDMCKHLQ